MIIGILDWLDEKETSAYPLVQSVGIDDIFLDANFIQFNGFIPILKTIVITEHTIAITITFDTGDQTAVLSDDTFHSKSEYKFYDNTRYIGRILFGAGVNQLWLRYTNQTITYNIAFISALVRAIPSNAGVYSIQSKFGAVTIASDTVISFAVAGNIVTCNAVGLNNATGLIPLKTLNGVGPVGNNITILDNQLIKVSGTIAEVKSSLIGANAQDSLTQLFTAIPTKT